MRRRVLWLALALALALAIACTKPVVHPSITRNDPLALPTEWVACRSDRDCIALEMDCCDHCNGGWVLAVNRAHQTRATAAYHASCDSWERPNPDGSTTGCGSWCTELGCGGIGQRCAGGRCVWTWDAYMNRHYIDQPNVILPDRIPHGKGDGLNFLNVRSSTPRNFTCVWGRISTSPRHLGVRISDSEPSRSDKLRSVPIAASNSNELSVTS